MNHDQTLRVRPGQIITLGLLASGIILYTSLVGMLESFNARDVVQNFVTLGQLLLLMPPFALSYLGAGWAIKAGSPLLAPVIGVVISILAAALPTLLTAVAVPLDMRRVFVNVSPRLLDFLSFGQEGTIAIFLTLAGLLGAAGLAGALLRLVPGRFRTAMITGLGVTLLIGLLGDLLNNVISQGFDRATARIFFASGRLRQEWALAILVVVTVAALIGTYVRPILRARLEAQTPGQARVTRGASYALLGVLLLSLPWILGTYLSEVFSNVGLYILMALGLNIAVGLAGLLDLGYVTNFAVGAYTMAVLTSTGTLGLNAATGGDLVLNFWIVLPIAVLMAMLTGFVLALPVLRMRGDYLAIATLGFGEIIRLLALSDWLKPVIGGAQGILFIPKPDLFGTELVGPEQFYYIFLAACVLMVYISVRLNNSRTGRKWMAIREDEDVAQAMGINTAQSKLLAFTISAASGGLAGAIFAAKLGTVFPNSFGLLISINVLAVIIIGGMGSIGGIIVGAFALIGLPELLREFNEYRLLLYGILLVAMMLLRPEGLFPSAVRRREMQTDEDLPQTAPTASVQPAPGD